MCELEPGKTHEKTHASYADTCKNTRGAFCWDDKTEIRDDFDPTNPTMHALERAKSEL